MRFEEEINWSEGLFLQPHHLQRMQRNLLRGVRTGRSLAMPYPCGLVDFEMDESALAGNRAVVRRFSAVMPDGTELSMPGNVALQALDVSEEVKSRVSSFKLCIALPSWNEFDANLSDGAAAEKRIFVCHDEKVRDENTGDNEIEVSHRRYNARLTTDQRDNTDLQLLPVARIKVIYHDEAAEPRLEVDRTYVPPFAVLGEDCPLKGMTEELCVQIRNRRAKLYRDLSASGYTTEALSGTTLYNVMQLQALNAAHGTVVSLLAARATPFDLYLALRELMGELLALQPMRGLVEPEYNHLDCGPAFLELFEGIRALILAEGVSSYVKVELERRENGAGGLFRLKDEHIVAADEYYLAIKCAGDPRRIVAAVEHGDNIKLVSPSGGSGRTRGIKLAEVRYPPRFLPAVPDAIWFRLEREESSRIWDDVRDEGALLLDWADEVFPGLAATLYVSLVIKK